VRIRRGRRSRHARRTGFCIDGRRARAPDRLDESQRSAPCSAARGRRLGGMSRHVRTLCAAQRRVQARGMSASVEINRPDPTHPGVERLRLVNDCPCVVLRDEAQAIALLNELIVSRQGGYSVAINAEKILYYGSRADVRELIDRSTLPYADGVGAVWGLKWMHGCKAARKINMPVACIDGAAQHGWRLFVTGAREEVNRDAVEAMRRRHPHIRIVGRMNGYEPESRRIQAIKSARPDLVMVALGSPAQERFAAKLLTRAPG